MIHFVSKQYLSCLDVNHDHIEGVDEYCLETQHNNWLVFLGFKVQLNVCIFYV